MGLILSKLQALGPRRAAAAVLFALVLRSTLGRRLEYWLHKRPPGPIPMPIVGNFPLLSPPNTPPGLHRDFWRIAQQYGPVYSLWFGNNYGIVLNSRDAFFEALKTKQDTFAARPVLKSFQALTHGQGVAMNNGPRWRMIRTTLQTHVTNKQKGAEAAPIITEEISSTLAGLRDRCARGLGAQWDLRQTCRREALNVLVRKLFSFRFSEEETPAYFETQDWVRIIFEHIAQGSPSDFMPIAGLFPNAEEQHYVATVKRMEDFVDGEIASHRRSLSSTPPEQHDFVHAMLAAQKEAQARGEAAMTDVDIRVVCWDCLAGGLDTSATTMEWLVYILCNYPEVQRKVHAALDKAVGDDRLPTLEDVPQLEYLTAVLCECMRWKHFAPQGLPHEAEEDTTLQGFNVPKGTQVFLNFFSLHMNKEYWVRPEEFRPERFLEEEKGLLDTLLHPEKFFPDKESYKFVPYGQGRRRCVGYGLGRIALWLKAALWLHCFSFESADGKPMDLDTEVMGITMMPKEQRVKATPRKAAKLLRPIGEGLIEQR